jgi:uncharacterized protein (TIGR02246 family)
MGTVREAIEALDEAFVAAYRSRDAAGVAALYTEQAQILPPNADFLIGRAAIQAFWQRAMDGGIGSFKFELLEVEEHGDTAIGIVRVHVQAQDGAKLDTAKAMVVWKRVGGAWKLHRDMFNSSTPTPG